MLQGKKGNEELNKIKNNLKQKDKEGKKEFKHCWEFNLFLFCIY